MVGPCSSPTCPPSSSSSSPYSSSSSYSLFSSFLPLFYPRPFLGLYVGCLATNRLHLCPSSLRSCSKASSYVLPFIYMATLPNPLFLFLPQVSLPSFSCIPFSFALNVPTTNSVLPPTLSLHLIRRIGLLFLHKQRE